MVVLTDRDYENVYGLTYRAAWEQMQVLEQAIADVVGKGFDTAEACAKFASDVHVDIMMLHKSTHSYLSVDHHGYALKPAEWSQKYSTVLFYRVNTEEGVKLVAWHPDPYKARNTARINSEKTDGISQPLYYRDFFAPFGYFNHSKGCFNTAAPFKFFAKQTGADTSHIYQLIQHLAKENTLYLLAWLRQKMCNPYKKTEVMPIFVGGQGTGKSTFGEVICRAMFGEENVLVTYQYDSTARFNADQSDALIVSIEEKTQDDKRNSAAALKSSATATHVRKEQKGVDPSYQVSYTDFVMSTNDDVPLKFDDGTDQRRFMVMEVDKDFTRENPLADAVFTKLYGIDALGNQISPGLLNDKDVVAQFKHELYMNENVAKTNPKEFIRTEAFTRCFTIPRTNEAIEIETIVKSLAPFIQQSLVNRKVMTSIDVLGDDGDKHKMELANLVTTEAVLFVNRRDTRPDRIALCRPIVFAEQFTAKPYAHSVVDKTLRTMQKWLRQMYGLELLAGSDTPSSGFKGVKTRHKYAPAAWFALNENAKQVDWVNVDEMVEDKPVEVITAKSLGYRARYSLYAPDPNGLYETLNELPVGCTARKAENALKMDTFLLEGDETTLVNKQIEAARLAAVPEGGEINAEELYANRLKVQEEMAEKLLKDGIAWRAVYSGTKSIHLLVTIDPAPATTEERRWLDAHIKTKLGGDTIAYDMLVSDPTRLTRYPFKGKGVKRVEMVDGRKVVGYQRLLVLNEGVVWEYDWRPEYNQWLSKPASHYEARGRKMLPSRPVYREAAQAILDGTFFTDSKWNGRRQETFFPAYRLVRHLGFTHDEVWTELNSQIDGYYKYAERDYWRTRATGKLVISIDEEVGE
jgi:hypothetical protein